MAVVKETFNTIDLVKTRFSTRQDNSVDLGSEAILEKTSWQSNEWADILSVCGDGQAETVENKCFISSKRSSCHVTIMEERSVTMEVILLICFRERTNAYMRIALKHPLKIEINAMSYLVVKKSHRKLNYFMHKYFQALTN